MSIIVCLYSKYSEKCRSFLEFVSTTPIDMKMLCVDNEKTRSLIQKDDPRYHIRIVPCLLVFHVNGVMEKKEGFETFEYVQSLMKQMHLSPSPSPSSESNMSSMIPVTTISGNTDQVDSLDRYGPIPPPPFSVKSDKDDGISNPRHHNSPNSPTNSPNHASSEGQNMNNNNNMDIPSIPPHPPLSLERTAEDSLPTEAKYVNKKKESILSLAASMAKQRESEDEQMHPNPYAKVQEAQESIMGKPGGGGLTRP